VKGPGNEPAAPPSARSPAGHRPSAVALPGPWGRRASPRRRARTGRLRPVGAMRPSAAADRCGTNPQHQGGFRWPRPSRSRRATTP
jgi:hypothetical protein